MNTETRVTLEGRPEPVILTLTAAEALAICGGDVEQAAVAMCAHCQSGRACVHCVLACRVEAGR